MFKCISTGLNENYGKKGQIVNIGNSFVVDALRKNWIYGHVVYLGKGKKWEMIEK